jgi:hypothetical protein
MSIHFTREGVVNLFEPLKTFDEVTEHDEEHESELTLGELALDTAASMGAHKAPMNSSMGVLLYGVAKNSDQNPMHAVAGGVSHLFLDTCIEISFERLAHFLAASGVDALFLKPLAPMSAVVPLIVGAHAVRVFRDTAMCYLPSDPYIPLTMGDPEVACTAEEAKVFLNLVSLPSHGLQRLHHYLSGRIVAGLHYIGVTDEHMEMMADAARFPIRTLGASMLGPGSNISELLGRDRVMPLIPKGESRERLQRVFELVRPESLATRYFRDVQIENRPFRRPVASGVPTFAAVGSDERREDARASEIRIDPIRSLAETYFKQAKVSIKEPAKLRICHAAGDRITEMLNHHLAEEEAYRALEREVCELRAYFERRDEGALLVRDRERLQGACLDAASAARNFGCPKLGVVFNAGYEMMRFEDAAKKLESIKDLKSAEGISAISSVTAAGLAIVNVFAALDNSPSDLLGPLQEVMKRYNVQICHKIQEICGVLAHCHTEKIWEFEKVRFEFFSMFEDVKAQNSQLLKEISYLKQAIAIGFARMEEYVESFGEEIDYRVQEIRLESLRKVEDGINHYEFGKVSLDTIKEWGAVLERWLSDPPAKKMMTGEFYADSDRREEYIKRSTPAGKIGLMATLANVEEAHIESLVNLDTVESLLDAYITVLKILRQEGELYDPRGILWQEKLIGPIQVCERIARALNLADYAPWQEHHAAYMNQIARIQRNIAEKREEILALPSLISTREKLERTTAMVDASEGLLADKLQALIAALAARK